MTSSPMTIADAQRDMRAAYFGGAAGVLASALAWLTAGLVAWRVGPEPAVLTLFAGGMLIHPVAVLLVKALGRTGAHAPGNPLGRLAIETTAWLILSLPLAWFVSRYRLGLFFPAMLLVIGGRYATFATLFGTRLFWACGAALAVAAYALAATGAPPAVAAFTGAAIEGGFAAALFAGTARRGL